MFAHYAKATSLIEAIQEGKDVHRATGSIIYNKPYEEVTDDQRSTAKTINFALIYGMGDAATASSLGMGVGEARDFKNHYFAMIPEAAPFIYSVQRVTRTRGYIRNYYGRRRRLKSDEVFKATNALIQGCAADYIKHKMVTIYKYLASHNYKSRMILVVHDEIVFEIHKDEKFIIPKLRWLLSDFETFRAPITAGAEVGNPSWGEKIDMSDEVGFEELTEEEWQKVNSFDIFDGTVFDIK